MMLSVYLSDIILRDLRERRINVVDGTFLGNIIIMLTIKTSIKVLVCLCFICSKSETICMHIYKRAKHVTEVQMLRRSDHGGSDDFDCMKPDALGPKLPYVTLVNPDSKSHLCPNLGKYVSSGVSQDGRSVRDSCGLAGGQGAFHSVVVGCGNRATMEFHSKCATQEPITCKIMTIFHNIRID